jgi:DNA polymerase-3 subunit chi
MTRIDFYVLEPEAQSDRFHLACRVAEKAWVAGHRVLIQTSSPQEARHMDTLLWTFRDRSFVPHGLLGEADSETNPILIGHGTDAGGEDDVLINLSSAIPEFFSNFERVIEPVDSDPAVRDASRERYRFYRDRGYPLNNQRIAG